MYRKSKVTTLGTSIMKIKAPILKFGIIEPLGSYYHITYKI